MFSLWVYNEVITKFESLWHNKNRKQICLKITGQIEFKPTFSLEVWCIWLWYLNV